MPQDSAHGGATLEGIQAAFAFINKVREDTQLGAQVRGLERTGNLDGLRALGRQSGFCFTEDDLRRAFAADWRMRRLHADNEVKR